MYKVALKLDEATIDAYLRILRQFTQWVAKRPGQGKRFEPEHLTTTVVESYLSTLQRAGCDFSHILAMSVKHIMAVPQAQKPVDSKQATRL